MRLLQIVAITLVLILSGCGSPKPSPNQAAEKFFELCALRKFADAYESTTVAFRIEKSQKYFEARVRDLKLDGPTKIEWQEPQIKDDVAKRWGEVTVEGNPKMAVIVTMHRDGSTWRVHEVRYVGDNARHDLFSVASRSNDTIEATSRAFTESVSREAPTERLVRKMIEKTLLDFSAAIKAKDFTEFFGTISDRWKYRGMSQREIEDSIENKENRITIPQLHTAFKAFIDAGVDFSDITNQEMKLKEPARINSDGVLVADGEFSGPKTRTIFKMEYYFESGRWRLFGLTIDLKPAN